MPSRGRTFSAGTLRCLAFHNDSFDLVLQFTVYSSILDLNMKEVLAREMLRVLKRQVA